MVRTLNRLMWAGMAMGIAASVALATSPVVTEAKRALIMRIG
jgi:hypothetical protein